jgi:integrase
MGQWPDVSLADARAKREEARAKLRAGQNPAALRKQAKAQAQVAAGNTFRAVAEEWLDIHRATWRVSHMSRVESQFKIDIFPSIGDRPVRDVSPAEVLAIAKRIEKREALDMARRALQRMTAVFALAVRTLRADSNPARELTGVIRTKRVQHHAALKLDQMPDFLRRLDAVATYPETKAALELLVYTASRSGEIRGMRWSEIDFTAGVWTVPADRMKMDADHLVPLSTQAVAVLERMRPLTGDGVLVFPSPSKPKQALTANALLMMLRRMGYETGDITAHGFRATFSTTMNELGHEPDVIERALAHVAKDKVRAAYHRAAYLDERRDLLQSWADLVDSKRAGAEVIPIGRRARR